MDWTIDRRGGYRVPSSFLYVGFAMARVTSVDAADVSVKSSRTSPFLVGHASVDGYTRGGHSCTCALPGTANAPCGHAKVGCCVARYGPAVLHKGALRGEGQVAVYRPGGYGWVNERQSGEGPHSNALRMILWLRVGIVTSG